ncbi:MAG: hypothetical protein ACT4P3_14165 [Betaproteobacteria bacterium]
MRSLAILLCCAAVAGAARAAGSAASPELASFADLVRLSAAAPLAAAPAAAPAPLRVTLVQPLPAEPRFAVRAPREPGRWLLLFSGLALAAWVAHRRLAGTL